MSGDAVSIKTISIKTISLKTITIKTKKTVNVFLAALFVLTGCFSSAVSAQDSTARVDAAHDVATYDTAPDDTATIESIIAATYESIARAPGEDYDWDRFLSLFLNRAILIPNSEQSGGNFRVLSPQGFVDWISGVTTIGGVDDKGFAEEGYHNKIDRYGDIANVMSSYQKHYWGEKNILGRGINSFQLVWTSDRWWIAGIAWDETYAAGPVPEKYGGEHSDTQNTPEMAKPCTTQWFKWIEEEVATGDGQGHGPDPGSDEWKSTIIFRLGLRGVPEVPALDSREWCEYVDNIVRAR